MAKIDEDFVEFEHKVQQIMGILNEGPDAGEPQTEPATKTRNFDDLDVDNVRLTVRENRTLINKSAGNSCTSGNNMQTMDQQSFMQQVERDANERADSRAQREKQAQQQRSQGNEAFRQRNFEKAILHYGQALERVRDSAISYNNRALCYIKLHNYKRAVQDCDHVLQKLDEGNLRAWLYRAAAYKRLGDGSNYEASVQGARQHNPDQNQYIDKFIAQMDIDI